MAGNPIADPRADINGQYAGVNSVRSDGSTASSAIQQPPLLVAPGDSDLATYVLPFNVAPVAAMDVFSICSTGSRILRVRRIVLVNPGSATAAAVVDLQLAVAPGGTFGSGGSTPTPQSLDQTLRVAGVTGGPDGAPSGGTFHVGDTTQATGIVQVYDPLVTVSVPAAAGGFTPLAIYDERRSPGKTLTGGRNNTGVNNIVVLRIPAVGAGATGFRGYVEFTISPA